MLRATGLEAERHIPFAGLLQLLRPALGYIDGLAPAAGGGSRRRARALGRRARKRRPVHDRRRGARPAVPVRRGGAGRRRRRRPARSSTCRRPRPSSSRPGGWRPTRSSCWPRPAAQRRTAWSRDSRCCRLGGLDRRRRRRASLPAPQAARSRPGGFEPLLTLAEGNPLALLELAGDDLDALATDPAELPARVPDTVTAAFARRLDLLGERVPDRPAGGRRLRRGPAGDHPGVLSPRRRRRRAGRGGGRRSGGRPRGSGGLPAPAGAGHGVLPRGRTGAEGGARRRRRVPARGRHRPSRLAPGRGRLEA